MFCRITLTASLTKIDVQNMESFLKPSPMQNDGKTETKGGAAVDLDSNVPGASIKI